ncbi:MAG: DNA-processing protein DprA [bacterium]|nr:DNA-processing protein DprA [bacterium]
MPDSIVRARLGQEVFVEKLLKERQAIDPDVLVESLQRLDIKALTILDDNYPKLLKEIFSPPVVLYYRGNIDVLSAPSIAVVGSRKITTYGKNATEKIVSGLAQAGYVVVSGMALGVDTFVHETTLLEQGKTVAVLGCGLDKPYPVTNTNLFKKIIESGGVVISEYMPGKPPLKQHFPARNRIISGLSQGILVVEANIRSGALITARDALEQNRDVFAIPGPIFGESSSGTNKLLKMGANLITEAEDIFEFYGHTAKNGTVKSKPSNENEAAVFGILEDGEKHIDEIIKGSGKESQLIISTLTLMEIKGKVKNLGGMVYILN